MGDSEQDPGSEMTPLSLDAVPGLARIAAGAWYRGATWGIGTALRASERLSKAAVSGESAAELIEEIRAETIENLRRVVGAVEEGGPDPVGEAAAAIKPDPQKEDDRERVRTLRERGAGLLDRAAELDEAGGGVHPGFERILGQLAPDEARILKLLVNEGPQPIVYVNKAAPFGLGARAVARRLSLIGREAGCMRPELFPAYLDNLLRLGLAAIRRDPIPDEQAYQVVEAQPEVVEAIKSVGSGPLFRGHTSRRSVHVTEYGRTFCQVCFPPEHLTGEFEAIELDPEADLVAPERDLEGAEPTAED